MAKNEYYPIVDNEEPLHLEEPSFGVYEDLKRIMLKSSVIDITSKNNIIAEFNLDPGAEIKTEYGAKEYYKKIAETIFIEKENIKDVDARKINIGELNRATSNFFRNAAGV